MRVPEKPEDLSVYTGILTRIVSDAASLCSVRLASVDHDLITIRLRAKSNGISFFTKDLPALGKCLDKALSSDRPFSDFNDLHSFAVSKTSGKLPVFLGAFFKLVFDDAGTVREDLDAESEMIQCEAVRSIRQICYLLYKLEGAHSKDSEQAVLDDFVVTDRSLPGEEELIPLSHNTALAIEKARIVIQRVLKGFDPWDIVPGHGPGSVSGGEKGWEKMNFSRFFPKLDEEYSYSDYFFFNYTHLADELDILERLTLCETSTAKVMLVPKDSRGPRLISMEPLEIQWIQQGLLRSLVRTIERRDSEAAGYVNFTDQEINRRLALENSYNGELVTLDMKEASDRVSLWLVRQLFPERLYKCLKACRSDETILPGGHRLSLKKFAPMGSSVCFPVEALVFWALAVGSLTDAVFWNNNVLYPEVYVYGDDIISRKEDYERFRPIYEELHLKFNEDKCCVGKYFRESCGMDAFKLKDVSYLKLKARWSKLTLPAASLSYVSCINSLRGRGYSLAADYLQKRVTQKLGPVPVSGNAHALQYAIHRPNWSELLIKEYNRSFFRSRFNKQLQREEVRVPCPESLTLKRGEPGWSELLRLHRFIGLRQDNPEVQTLGPCSYAVPRQIKMRWRWLALEVLAPVGLMT